jgi:hypothetical protein
MKLERIIAIWCVGLYGAACSADDVALTSPDGGAGSGASSDGGATRSGSGGTKGPATGGNGGTTNPATGGSGGTTNPATGGTAGGGGTTDAGRGPQEDASTGDAADGATGPDASHHEPVDGALNDGGHSTDGGRREKRLFLTHDGWDGDLVSAAHTLGLAATTGIVAADALCNRAAAQAGLGGVWVAWLSDATHDAIARVVDVGPWYRVDGAKVFDNEAALTGNPLVAIELDERGNDTELTPDGGGLANVPWTGTLANGTRSPSTCGDWTSNSSSTHGLVGANTATTQRKWTEGSLPLCDQPYPLYCFEQ